MDGNSAFLLDVLQGREVHGHGRTHGGGDIETAPVAALGTAGLVAVDGFLQGLEVVEQLGPIETGLAKAHMHDAGAVGTELEFAGLELGDGTD